MAITWRNINAPDFRGSSQLAVSAGETIVSGIDTLRQAAQSVYDDERANEQQDFENQLALDKLNLDRSKADTANQLASARIANEQATLDSQNKLRAISSDVLGNLSTFDSAEAATRELTQLAQEHNLSLDEVNQLNSQVQSTWATNIGTNPAQKQLLEQTRVRGEEHLASATSNATRKLDQVAKANGLNPLLAGMATDTSQDISDVYAEFGEKIADSGALWKEDDTALFERRFAEEFGRNPTGAEARYLLSVGLNEGGIFTDTGLDQDMIDPVMAKYKSMLGNSDLINWYINSKSTINKAASEEAARQAKELTKYGKQAVSNNQKAYNRDYNFTPLADQNVSVVGSIPTLNDTSWLQTSVPKN